MIHNYWYDSPAQAGWAAYMAVRFLMGCNNQRSIVYIDGFNLYYGAVKGGPHKWLDFQRLFSMLRPDDDIQKIWYFTALIDGPRRAFQERYLEALETLSLVEVVLGRYKFRTARCTVRGCDFDGNREFKIPEEKRTDVNIAIQMVDDAHNQRADRMILVSGDSDLVPAVHRAKQSHPEVKVIVYVPSRDPQRGAAVELRGAADKDKTLPLVLIPRAQFPNPVRGGREGKIWKPEGW